MHTYYNTDSGLWNANAPFKVYYIELWHMVDSLYVLTFSVMIGVCRFLRFRQALGDRRVRVRLLCRRKHSTTISIRLQQRLCVVHDVYYMINCNFKNTIISLLFILFFIKRCEYSGWMVMALQSKWRLHWWPGDTEQWNGCAQRAKRSWWLSQLPSQILKICFIVKNK